MLTTGFVFLGIWGFFIAYQTEKAIVDMPLPTIQFKLFVLSGEPHLCPLIPGAHRV